MVWGAVLAAGATLYSGKKSSDAAKDAAGAQAAASMAGIEAQERATEQLRRDLAPYSSFGVGALGPLSNALGIPLNQPTYSGQAGSPDDIDSGSSDTIVEPEAVNITSGSRQDELSALISSLQAKKDSIKASKVSEILKRDIQSQIDSAYQELISLPPTEASSQLIQDQAAQGNIPDNVLQSIAVGGSPVTQSEAAQNIPEAAFSSRAEGLMGGSENPLLQQAMALRQDGSQVLQNPLLRSMQEDVQRRLFANQAARGKLGSGGTLEELQNRMIPMALDFREREISGLTGLGTTLEDMRQREIDDLFRASGLGANAAARQGQAGLNAASNIGNLQANIGQAQAQGAYGQALGRNQMIGAALGGFQDWLNRPSGVAGGYSPGVGFSGGAGV